MQCTVHKGTHIAGAILIALAAVMTVPRVAFAKPRAHAGGRAHQLSHKLARRPHIEDATVAVTYAAEATRQAATVSDSGFWLKGGSVDAALTFYRGLGLAANFSAVHASNIAAGVDAGKTSIVFGPSYTFDTTDWVSKRKWLKKEDWFKRAPRSQIFAEALFGVAHGFDGQFPEGASIATSANSAAFQLGAGLDLTFSKHFGARAIELDYVRSGLPNGAGSSQNDLRLSFGVNYRWKTQTVAPGTSTVPSAK